MTATISVAEMRALERRSMESGRASGLELMERAGQGVVDAVLATWPALAEHPGRAEIFCGPGNNGGDGFVVARLLKDRGWQVGVRLWGDPAHLPPDARANWERLAAADRVAPGAPAPAPDLMVDALFGTGLARPIDDPDLWEVLWEIDDQSDLAGIDRAHARTVAIDIPSGLSADTGEVLGGVPEHGLRAARAMLTVTFHAPKPGHLQGAGPDLCGRLAVADIGL
ncbi:NAD(P)H-hydrate epimerase [Rhodobacteraceae bacterium CCMM004]|nr:NAD(P)H-hydrate epimerase [Rhodobacteraceae bacterium CCMM004]